MQTCNNLITEVGVKPYIGSKLKGFNQRYRILLGQQMIPIGAHDHAQRPFYFGGNAGSKEGLRRRAPSYEVVDQQPFRLQFDCQTQGFLFTAV